MRLRNERLAVNADIAELGYNVGEILVVMQGLPFAVPGEPAHVRRRPALVLGAEGFDVGPRAGLRTVGAPLTVDLLGDHVLTDQAGHHAGPAPVRVLVIHVLERDRLVAARV